ncbi:unnamed protein product [Paramecium pentaurelia]|uniref:Uncharacterized protein n=1 Tax=Paramecium pentaurelia TaxID=43138 RepID=A0A8S1VGH8_9CILI|nr:unnamed protein product [Paramecium pentaurelia]
MACCSCSQSLIFTIVLITLLFAAVTIDAVRFAWLTISFMFGIMLMIDYMFSYEKGFMYDPDYKTWRQKTQSDA